MKKKNRFEDEAAEENIDQGAEDFEEYEDERDLQSLVKNNSTIIIIASIVVIAIVAVVLYMRNQGKEEARDASLALSRIAPYYQGGKYDLALDGNPQMRVRGDEVKGLKDIVSEYGDTEPGMVAALYAGNCFLGLDSAGAAISYFEDALESESEVARVGANAGLAACYESQGDYEKAAGYYHEAGMLSLETDAKGRYMYYAALCYEKAGKKDEAGPLYRDVINNKWSYQFAGLAKAALTRLGMKIE